MRINFGQLSIRTYFVLLALTIVTALNGQETGKWNNKNCAVCLTYDDALNVDLDNVIPALDSLGFKGTFYVPGYFPGFGSRVDDWRAAADEGHELGNHSLFHPCEGDADGREWVDQDYDLNDYPVKKLIDELKMANVLLNIVDGKTTRTFAYTCGDTLAGGKSFVPELKSEFAGARSVVPRYEYLDKMNLYDIGSFMIWNNTGEELVDMVKKAMEKKALIVFLFHGVGGEHNINVSLKAHSKLLKFLKENEDEIWIAPMVDVAEYVKASRVEEVN